MTKASILLLLALASVGVQSAPMLNTIPSGSVTVAVEAGHSTRRPSGSSPFVDVNDLASQPTRPTGSTSPPQTNSMPNPFVDASQASQAARPASSPTSPPSPQTASASSSRVSGPFLDVNDLSRADGRAGPTASPTGEVARARPSRASSPFVDVADLNRSGAANSASTPPPETASTARNPFVHDVSHLPDRSAPQAQPESQSNPRQSTLSSGDFVRDDDEFERVLDRLFREASEQLHPSGEPSGQQPAQSPTSAGQTSAPDDESEPERCPICLEDLEDLDQASQVEELPCGHKLHRHCGREWYRSKNTCPICRSYGGGSQFD